MNVKDFTQCLSHKYNGEQEELSAKKQNNQLIYWSRMAFEKVYSVHNVYNE